MDPAVLDSDLFSRQLTWADAQRFHGVRVRVQAPTPTGLAYVVLSVCSVSESPAAPGMHQFAIRFEGPADIFLEQGTYRVHHPELGDFAVFMTPTARLPQGFTYEACFAHVV